MDQSEFNRLGTRYRGGLTVLDVRPSSPAAQQGIRRGDVLVGMHVWETISLENISYILDRDDLSRLDSIVFYIVRGSETLYGHLRLAQRTTP
jgi:serine protease Do